MCLICNKPHAYWDPSVAGAEGKDCEAKQPHACNYAKTVCRHQDMQCQQLSSSCEESLQRQQGSASVLDMYKKIQLKSS